MNKPTIILLCFSLLLGQLGCSITPPLQSDGAKPLPPFEKVRRELGTIGVVSAHYAPKTKFSVFAKRKGSGAGKGAVAGAAAGLESVAPLFSGTCEGPICGPILLLEAAILITATTVGAISGAIAGSEAAIPEELADDTETKIQNALVYLNIQEAMRENVLEIAREQTFYNFVTLKEEGPTAPHEEASYSSLADKGIDTVLEISVIKIYTRGGWGKDPVLSLSMDVLARLVRTLDNKELFKHKFIYRSQAQKFAEWYEDNALRFRQEFGRAYKALAERIVDKIFLVYPPILHH